MRIRSRKNLPKKNIAITVLFLLPLIGMLSFIGFVFAVLYDVASYTYVMPVPDTDDFYPLEDIDTDYFAVMAENYELRLEKYHMPTNISQDISYTDYNYNDVKTFHGTDNGNLHVGYTVAAECLKYYVAVRENNIDDRLNASDLVRRGVSALSDFMAAPNGGLGINPETGDWYPGTLARFVAAPGTEDIHSWMFDMDDPHYKHFNGTGAYKNWRVRLYTSRDELGGFYLACASVLKFIDPNIDAESKWIYNRVVLLVKQMIEGFKDTNWLLLGGEGNPTGSDLNPVLEGSTWQLALCRMAASADPEEYMSLYQYVLAKALASGSMGDVFGVIGGYYGYSFGLDVMLTLIWLEDDPHIRFRYIKNYENNFYINTRYHRNTFHNMAHLIFMEMLSENERKGFENPKYSDENIRWDCLDQLWRFKTSGWEEGVRDYNLLQRPHSTRATSTNPQIALMERSPREAYWREFFETNPLGTMIKPIIEFEWDFSEGSELYLLPITVSEYGCHHWVWEHNKLDDEGGNSNGNGLKECAPNSFICMYWMARAYEII